MVDLVAKYAAKPGIEYPRPQGRILELTELEAGDVLLSRGTTEISNAVVAADGASYSHAALWSGESIIEAILDGVQEHDWSGERDVYRYASQAGDPLAKPVSLQLVDIARRHVGQGYAHSELLLLGMMFSAGLVPARPLLNVLLELLGGQDAVHLAAWLQSLAPACGPMMCSELVAHAYYEASPARTYALYIVPRAQRAPNPALTARRPAAWPAKRAQLPKQEPELAALQQACSELLRPARTDSARARERKCLFGEIAKRSGTGEPLGVVTPGDLQFSASLRFIGRVAG